MVTCPVCGRVFDRQTEELFIELEYSINTPRLGKAYPAIYCDCCSSGCDAVFSPDGIRIYAIHYKNHYRTTLPLEMI